MASSRRSITDAVPNGVIDGENLEGDASDVSNVSSSDDDSSDDNASWVSDTDGVASDFLMSFDSENDSSDDESDDDWPPASRRPAYITPEEEQKPNLVSISSQPLSIPAQPATGTGTQSPTALAKLSSLTDTTATPVQPVAQSPSTVLEGSSENESPEADDGPPAPKRLAFITSEEEHKPDLVSTSSYPLPIPAQPATDTGTQSPTALAKRSSLTDTTATPVQPVAHSPSTALEGSSKNESHEDDVTSPTPNRCAYALRKTTRKRYKDSNSYKKSAIPAKQATNTGTQSPTAQTKPSTLTDPTATPVKPVTPSPSSALAGSGSGSPEDNDGPSAPKRPAYTTSEGEKKPDSVSTSSQPSNIPVQPAAESGIQGFTALAKPSTLTDTTATPVQSVAQSAPAAPEGSSENESPENFDGPSASKRWANTPKNKSHKKPYKVTTATQLTPTSTDPATRKKVKVVAKDGTVWENEPPRIGKTPSANILREKSGPKNLGGASTQLSFFELFMTDPMLQEILKHSNVRGLSKEGKQWEDITMMELRACLGLLLYLGLTKSGHENVRSFWSPGMFSRPTCQATMTGVRFQALMGVMCFDERSTRSKRKAQDKFAPIREMFEMFAKACREHFKPGECVTVDEQLVAFRGRCSFRQYIPRKPNKYGIKFWVCADSETNYVYNMKPYLGKQDANPKMNTGCRVVADLVEPLYGSGRNVTADNFFISKTLADYLLTKKLSLVGTVRAHRREIPVIMRKETVKERKVKSSKFLFNGMTTLVSYVPKKNKNVTLLSTMHHNKAVILETSKPEIIHYYNSTKSGVDTVDQMCSVYNCARITKRWTQVVFFNMLNIAAVNAYVLWRQVNPESSGDGCHRHTFLKELITGLVEPQIKKRAKKHWMRRHTKKALDYLGYEVTYQIRRETEKNINHARVCFMCKRRTTRLCTDCNRFACTQHCTSVKTTVNCCVKCEHFP